MLLPNEFLRHDTWLPTSYEGTPTVMMTITLYTAKPILTYLVINTLALIIAISDTYDFVLEIF